MWVETPPGSRDRLLTQGGEGGFSGAGLPEGNPSGQFVALLALGGRGGLEMEEGSGAEHPREIEGEEGGPGPPQE